MKKLFATLIFLGMACVYAHAGAGFSIHENVRTTPYPDQGHTLFLNPAPLLVPLSMKESDFLQFNLSQDSGFDEKCSILSEPRPWCMFNPHRVLKAGTWYWRVRSVSKTGDAMPWSETYSFVVGDDAPQFVTPEADKFLNNIPAEGPRIYCFLNDGLEKARAEVRSHPEFEYMIDDSRTALAISYKTESKPYSKITQMAASCDKLNTAYQMLQKDLYADKMVENVRCLLATEPDPKVIRNDFHAGELVYTLACTYDNCRDRFTADELKHIEDIIMDVLSQYYYKRILGHEETHIFDNHFWQFTFRHLMQGALLLYDKYPLAKEYLEYSYELWTARAPATGFNRDGAWHNGPNYFSANCVTLCYVPTLFGYVTGTDFLGHPWYKNVGRAMTYSWMPDARSIGYGDGHEKSNGKPLRIRSAFADFIARNTGDTYAAWYSTVNDRYKHESETRLYRMASGKQRPATTGFPAESPKAVWFKDCGEMVANSNTANLGDNLSLSFHSSPFGSGSHTHSCQNAFNLQYGGKAIYYAIGHYMNFSDPHNLLSYRHTRAYNSLLVDGIGQAFTTRAYGNIVQMFDGENISYALGDASNAYRSISEYPMWKKNFAAHGLEQSRENGFGETPLTRYRRYIFMLHPNIIVIYDDLEASKNVSWSWLLHSPIKFDIDNANATLTTADKANGIYSVARLFSRRPCEITQTDRYVAAPNEAIAQRGEDFTAPWSLTANFAPSKSNRILTIIQVETNDAKVQSIDCTSGRYQCGDWVIDAELDSKRPAALSIYNNRNRASYKYGSSKGSTSSIIYDKVGEKWTTTEINDGNRLSTGEIKSL